MSITPAGTGIIQKDAETPARRSLVRYADRVLIALCLMYLVFYVDRVNIATVAPSFLEFLPLFEWHHVNADLNQGFH